MHSPWDAVQAGDFVAVTIDQRAAVCWGVQAKGAVRSRAGHVQHWPKAPVHRGSLHTTQPEHAQCCPAQSRAQLCVQLQILHPEAKHGNTTLCSKHEAGAST